MDNYDDLTEKEMDELADSLSDGDDEPSKKLRKKFIGKATAKEIVGSLTPELRADLLKELQ